ncbi:methyltransferase domain-containing protein [Nesterenkonia sp. LB17]|uniref:class I SAM-dependent methyltransferase n=1 Tax=Nesterenkonia sp. LB17 TaxID=2901230 RepID=UPI001F4CB22D|nr:methyltransferase domain-containing protein [Nesterenkonia sp. LB17]MCH8566268.1 methyltransferase domain-containing protein [Nesterenkonia sp. LB17]
MQKDSAERYTREKYTAFAPFYDLLSAEHPVYGAGRRRLIESLALREGDQVLDLGCGTGLNFGPLQNRVGLRGVIVGIDRSAQMLVQARKRAQRHGWDNVILIQADATTMVAAEVSEEMTQAGGSGLSRVGLATYSLSLMDPWVRAWGNMWQLTEPEAELGVLDMQLPSGVSALLSPLARAACRLGGADIEAHPWAAVERDCADLRSASARGGHLQVRVGVKPAGRR